MDGSGNACERGAPTLYGSSFNGQWVLPLPLPLAFHPQKKGYIPSGEGVGGYKTAAMSFDGDGIHSLANTENKIPEIPKATCLCWCCRRAFMWLAEVCKSESFMWCKIWTKHFESWGQNLGTCVKRITKTLQEGYNFTYLSSAHIYKLALFLVYPAVKDSNLFTCGGTNVVK